MISFPRLLIVGILLVASSASAAPPPGFADHVRAGDRARAEGRLTDAAAAYLAALKLQDDPVVSGRLGLVLFRLGETRLAASTLVRAMEDQAALSATERAQVTKAFEAARREVCRLTIRVNRLGAELAIDGRVIQQSATGADVVFLDPGEHTITAKLEGHEPDSEVMTAEKGGVATVTLELRPIEAPPAPAPAPPAPSSSSSSGGVPLPPTPPAQAPKESAKASPPSLGPKLQVGAGAAAIWGLAPSPVLGPSVSISVRWGLVSIGTDFRAAWSLPIGLDGAALRGASYAGALRGCGHLRWVLGCGLVQIGAVEYHRIIQGRDLWLGTVAAPALGVAAGFELPEAGRFRFRARGELAGLLRRPEVEVGGGPGWSASWFVGGVTIEGVAAF